MIEPGVHDLTESEYDAIDALRSSVAWKMVAPGSTPRHALWAIQHPNAVQKKAFDLGSAAHAQLLGKGKSCKIVDAPDWKTQKARVARDKVRLDGGIPLLPHEWDAVKAMYQSAKLQLEEMREGGALDVFPFDPGLGEPEKTLIWAENGLLCKSRLDWLPHDCETLVDYKSTAASADPNLWRWRQMRELGFVFRLAFYRRGLEALGLANSPRYQFIVQENFAPYMLSVIAIDDELIEREDANVHKAMKLYAKCKMENHWPGYNPEGYVIGLTEKERMAMEAQPQQWGNAGHLSSEDVAAGI